MSKTPVAVSRKRIWIEFLSLFSPQKKSGQGRDWVYPSFMELLKKVAVISKWTVNWDSGQDFLFSYRLNENAGDCYDDALCESFLAILECELLDRLRFKTQAEARMSIFGVLERWYNLSWNTKGNMPSTLETQALKIGREHVCTPFTSLYRMT